jgi:CHAT domain-containing protein/tetratricopeptide (TPR) repeat protein
MRQMRKTVMLLIAAMVLVFSESKGAPAEAEKDFAEQLAAKTEQWAANLHKFNRPSRLLSGITQDQRVMTIALAGLPFDTAQRREFLIWLCQKYKLTAYVYLSPMQRRSLQGPLEGLDIWASSRAKDVFIGMSVKRRRDGSIHYKRDFYRVESAKEGKPRLFAGLNRTPNATNPTRQKEFEQIWAALESKVEWAGGREEVRRAVEPGAVVSAGLEAYASGNCNTALELEQAAAKYIEAASGEQNADFAMALMVQGLCRKKLGQVAEAEGLYRRAVDIFEKVQGPNGLDLAIALDNLGTLFFDTGRLQEAESLRLRALEIFRTTLDPADPNITIALQNLAVLYQYQGRIPEAQARLLEAMTIEEKAFGEASRNLGIMSDNLAGIFQSQRQFEQAEIYYKRALSIFEKTLGPNHPDSVLALQNYAILLGQKREWDKAETNLKRAIAINERLYGPNHSSISAALNTLVSQYIDQKRWPDALAAARRSTAIRLELTRGGKPNAAPEGGRTTPFRLLAQVAYSAGAADPVLTDEAFMAAQRALETKTAIALSQFAARQASGNDALGRLLRERQDLEQEFEKLDKLLIAAVATPPERRNESEEEKIKSRMREIKGRFSEIDLKVSQQFPEYASLSRPSPVSISEVQNLLRPDEALVQFLDLPEVDGSEGGLVWVITKTDIRWVRHSLGGASLLREVAAIRCGLDANAWAAIPCESVIGKTGYELGVQSVTLPFDHARAHRLYQALFGQVEDLIRGRKLLIAASGPLSLLPFQVLVTVPPANSDHRAAAWLVREHAITILPAVSSLKALRQLTRPSRAKKPMIGFGNPLLAGPDSSYASLASLARESQSCKASAERKLAFAAGRGVGLSRVETRGGFADVSFLSKQVPLPETAVELCTVASTLHANPSDMRLGARATEREVKRLSESGELAQYRIVHFATHGALAGQVQGNAEPGLLLTPPSKPSEEDDGYLTASEIAGLKLDADWVILSACNTAAGGAQGAEALSGLARAFIYAQARALLVSHWKVDSDATVKLITSAMSRLAADKSIGRAEAMRQSMLALIDNGKPHEAHPAYWAPFIIVGEGGAAR